jgi:hypothetical protein
MFYLLYVYQAGYRYTNYSCRQHTKIRCKSLGIDYNFATYYTSFVSYPSGTELLGPSVAVGRGHEIILGPYAVSAETFFFWQVIPILSCQTATQYSRCLCHGPGHSVNLMLYRSPGLRSIAAPSAGYGIGYTGVDCSIPVVLVWRPIHLRAVILKLE